MSMTRSLTGPGPKPTRHNERTPRSHALMLIATGLIASSFPVGAAITDGLDPLVLTFLRFALAALMFLPIILWRYGLQVPSPRDLLRYSAVSACLVAFFWGMFAALRHTSALNTAAIFALTPSITAGFAALLLKDRLGPSARLALPIGAAGAVWIVFRGSFTDLAALELGVGDAIFLAATGAMGLYGPLLRRLHRGEPMAVMTFWTLVTGALWLLVLSGSKLPAVSWTAVPVEVYAGIAYLALFTTLFTFFVFQWSATVIGPTRVMAYTYLTPAIVLAIGTVLGHETPSTATLLGVVLVVSATLILQRAPTTG